MATHDDDTVVRMPKRSSSLLPPARKTVAGTEEEEAPPLAIDDIDLLPEADTKPYVAYGRPGNKPELTLHVLFNDGSSQGFDWSNFDKVDMKRVPGGKILMVRFTGLEPTELQICGCNLERLRVLVGHRRLVWIREHPSLRGFGVAATADDKAEIITGIIPVPWTPDRQARGAGRGG